MKKRFSEEQIVKILGEAAVSVPALSAGAVEIDPYNECDRATARGVQAAHQDAVRTAVCGHGLHDVLGAAREWSDHAAQGR